MRADLSVYLVTDAQQAARAGRDVPDVVRRAVAGGVRAVQVREKDATARDFLDVVMRIADELPDEVTLVVNDRVDVYLAARAAGARVSGVHVGQSDLPVDLVRELVGRDALIGLSASTPSQLRAAADSGARVDYVGIGALRETGTKSDAPAPLGLDGFARLVAGTAIPAVAIGGVTPDDLPGLRAVGAAGAAVASAICASADPTTAAARLRAAWEAGA